MLRAKVLPRPGLGHWLQRGGAPALLVSCLSSCCDGERLREKEIRRQPAMSGIYSSPSCSAAVIEQLNLSAGMSRH